MSASEVALLEADKEADLKYAQLIMEAERMLINVQQQFEREESASLCSSRASMQTDANVAPNPPPRNKRLESIKNAELNIELALSRSRNSQPELASGSIKDLFDHSSPKRFLQQVGIFRLVFKTILLPNVFFYFSFLYNYSAATKENDRTNCEAGSGINSN